MSATLENVTKKKPEPTADQKAAQELERRAREQGLRPGRTAVEARGDRTSWAEPGVSHARLGRLGAARMPG